MLPAIAMDVTPAPQLLATTVRCPVEPLCRLQLPFPPDPFTPALLALHNTGRTRATNTIQNADDLCHRHSAGLLAAPAGSNRVWYWRLWPRQLEEELEDEDEPKIIVSLADTATGNLEELDNNTVLIMRN